MKRSRISLLATCALFTTKLALADGESVPLDKVEAGTIKVNGVLTEWTRQLTPLSHKLQGAPKSAADLTARAALTYDDAALYVAADVQDDKRVRTSAYGEGEDHLALVLVFPQDGGSSQTVELNLFQGDPGNVAGAVIAKGGAKISSASLVEAPRTAKDGLTFEAKIPWSALGPGAKVRSGLRGAFKYVDNDGSGPKTIVGTSGESGMRLPPFPNDAEQSIAEGFAKDKGLTGAPQIDLVADLTGDELREHVQIWDRYLLISGPHFRDGKEFFFSDLGVDNASIKDFQLLDLTGDGKADIELTKRHGSGSSWIDGLEVSSFSDQGLTALFRSEMGVSTDQGTVSNTAKFSVSDKSITIALGTGNGLSASNFKDAPDGGYEALLVPWGTVRSRTFQWDGSKFSKSKEESKPADAGVPSSKRAPAAPEIPQPPPARPPTADELSDQVLSLYKKDHKIGAGQKPRIDLATNVAEDAQNERILVFGRELVVFGKGFQKGLSYVSIGLGFADAKDVADVTTRDLNGDGRAEILVRGVQHMKGPKDLGGSIERELLLVYTVTSDGKLARVFGAETGLVAGDKRVTSTLAFLPADKGMDLVLGPGHAEGWDDKTFPFTQAPSEGGSGSVEALVLPWASASRYRWSGAGYAK